MTPEQAEARARTRYFVMVLARLKGVAIAIFGLLVFAGRFEGVPPLAGYVLVLVGLIDIALVPRLLARRWRTPPAP